MTALIPKPTIESSTGQEERIDEAELAAAAFLARYQGRTLDAYRYDLRASSSGLATKDSSSCRDPTPD